MAQKNLLLVVSLLVMVGALVTGILLSRPDAAPTSPALGAGFEDGGPADVDPVATPVADADPRTGRSEVSPTPAAAAAAAAAGATELGEETFTVSGRVEDEFGRPVPGIEVRLTDTPIFGGDDQKTQSDSEGAFAFEAAVGDWKLVTASAEWQPARAEVRVESDGAAAEPVVLQLKRGGTVSGVVTDDLGRPVVGASVASYREEKLGTSTRVERVAAGEAVLTDAAGQFTLAGLDAGTDVRLRAWMDGYVAATASTSVGAKNLVAMRLDRLASVSVILVDTAGVPIEGSVIGISNGDGLGIRSAGAEFADTSAESTTDAEGRFVIKSVPPNPALVLVAVGDGHREARSLPIAVDPGASVEGVRITANRGAAIVVLVLDPDNRPVPDAVVEVARRGAFSQQSADSQVSVVSRSIRRETRDGVAEPDVVEAFDSDSVVVTDEYTDASGRATLRGLAGGAFDVRARHLTFASNRPVQVALPQEGIVEVQLTMRPAGFANVSVVDSDGKPVVGSAVRVVGPDAAGEVSAVHDASPDEGAAKVRIGPLAVGRYRAMLRSNGLTSVSLDGGAPAMISFGGAGGSTIEGTEVNFEVVAGETVDVELQAPQLTTLMGVVSDASGPVEGAEVRVESNAAPSRGMPFAPKHSGRCDAAGSFSVGGLEPGDYTLSWGRDGALVRHEAELQIIAGQRELRRDLVIAGGTIELRVVSKTDGKPIVGASVSLEREREAQAADASAPRQVRVMSISMNTGSEDGESVSMTMGGAGTVETDAEGVARILSVPAGRYTITVNSKRYAKVESKGVEMRDGAVVRPAPIVMVPGGSMTATMVGEQKPVAGAGGLGLRIALVELRPAGETEARTETAMNGTASFAGLAAGPYQIRARDLAAGGGAGDFGPWVDVEVVAGERAKVDVPLK